MHGGLLDVGILHTHTKTLTHKQTYYFHTLMHHRMFGRTLLPLLLLHGSNELIDWLIELSIRMLRVFRLLRKTLLLFSLQASLTRAFLPLLLSSFASTSVITQHALLV